MKGKRNYGGVWEASAHLAEFEQYARLALTSYEVFNEWVQFCAVPMFVVKGFRQEESPSVEFSPLKPDEDFSTTLLTTQHHARRSLIALLNEVGMKADALALEQLDARIRESD